MGIRSFIRRRREKKRKIAELREKLSGLSLEHPKTLRILKEIDVSPLSIYKILSKKYWRKKDVELASKVVTTFEEREREEIGKRYIREIMKLEGAKPEITKRKEEKIRKGMELAAVPTREIKGPKPKVTKPKTSYVLDLQKKLKRYVSDTERYRTLRSILEKHHALWKPSEVNKLRSELRRLENKHYLDGITRDFKELVGRVVENPHILKDPKVKRKFTKLLDRIDKAIENSELIARTYVIPMEMGQEIEEKRGNLRDALNLLRRLAEYPLTVQPGERRKIAHLVNIINQLEKNEKEVDKAWVARQLLESKGAKDLTEDERALIESVIIGSLKEGKKIDEDLLPEVKKLLTTYPKYWNERDVAFVENLIADLEKEERAIRGLAKFETRGTISPEISEEYIELTDPEKVMDVVKNHVKNILKSKLSAEVMSRIIEGMEGGEVRPHNIYKTPESWMQMYSRDINNVVYQITKELTGMKWDEKKGKWVKSFGVADSVPRVKVENLKKMIAEGLKYKPPSKKAMEGAVVFELPAKKKINLVTTYFGEEFKKFGKRKKRE